MNQQVKHIISGDAPSRPPTKSRVASVLHSLAAIALPASLSRPHVQGKSQANAGKGLRWCGAGLNVSLVGAVQMRLCSPMVYIFDGPAGSQNDEPAAIDMRLPVAEREYAPTNRELNYWPRFDSLTAGQRRYYLNWLSKRRTSIPIELGYTFLFIYGLERRALVDQSDHEVIFREVLHLRSLYSASGQSVNRSFESYSMSFLWFLVFLRPQLFVLADIQQLLQSPVKWREHSASALYWFALTKTALPDWAALRIAQCLPNAQQSVVTKRIGQEFDRLFCVRYKRRFPAGFQPLLSDHRRAYAYRPSSAAIRPIECIAPDPLSPASHYEPLSETWNECISELHKLSVLVGKNEDAKSTAEAWEAMPGELRHGTLHPVTDDFCRIVEASKVVLGFTVVLASELAVLIGLNKPQKLTAAQCRKLSQIAEHVGYCLEPDPYQTGKSWKVDQRIAVFLTVSDTPVEGSRYNGAACMLQIGVAIANADGAIGDGAMTELTQRIATAFDLNDSEQRRLQAMGAILIGGEVELSAVARMVKGLPPAQREKMATLTIAIASADGIITANELRILRRVYNNLGFATNEIDRAVTALRKDDEPTTVVRGHVGVLGEKIQLPSDSATKVLQLNHAAIAEIMKDTREVTEMLAAAMSVTEDEQQDRIASSQSPNASKVVDTGNVAGNRPDASAGRFEQSQSLPDRYVTLYEVLVSRAEWSMTDAEAIARHHGLMLSGAVEAINEWSFESLGGPVFIEETDRLIVETALLQ